MLTDTTGFLTAPRDPSCHYQAKTNAHEAFTCLLDDESLAKTNAKGDALRESMRRQGGGGGGGGRRRQRPSPSSRARSHSPGRSRSPESVAGGGVEQNHPDYERTLAALVAEFDANEALLRDLRERKAAGRTAAARAGGRASRKSPSPSVRSSLGSSAGRGERETKAAAGFSEEKVERASAERARAPNRGRGGGARGEGKRSSTQRPSGSSRASDRGSSNRSSRSNRAREGKRASRDDAHGDAYDNDGDDDAFGAAMSGTGDQDMQDEEEEEEDMPASPPPFGGVEADFLDDLASTNASTRPRSSGASSRRSAGTMGTSSRSGSKAGTSLSSSSSSSRGSRSARAGSSSSAHAGTSAPLAATTRIPSSSRIPASTSLAATAGVPASASLNASFDTTVPAPPAAPITNANRPDWRDPWARMDGPATPSASRRREVDSAAALSFTPGGRRIEPEDKVVSHSSLLMIKEMEARRAREEAEHNVRPTVNKIPASTMRPRMAQMNADSERRRKEGIEKRAAELKSSISTFGGMVQRETEQDARRNQRREDEVLRQAQEKADEEARTIKRMAERAGGGAEGTGGAGGGAVDHAAERDRREAAQVERRKDMQARRDATRRKVAEDASNMEKTLDAAALAKQEAAKKNKVAKKATPDFQAQAAEHKKAQERQDAKDKIFKARQALFKMRTTLANAQTELLAERDTTTGVLRAKVEATIVAKIGGIEAGVAAAEALVEQLLVESRDLLREENMKRSIQETAMRSSQERLTFSFNKAQRVDDHNAKKAAAHLRNTARTERGEDVPAAQRAAELEIKKFAALVKRDKKVELRHAREAGSLLEKVFDMLDEDASGEISRTEFVTAVKNDPGASERAQARNKEVRALLGESKALAPLINPETYIEAFDNMDTNRDGLISLQELATFCNEQLPALHEAATAKYAVQRGNGRPDLHCATRSEWQRAMKVETALVEREAEEAERAAQLLGVPQESDEEEDEEDERGVGEASSGVHAPKRALDKTALQRRGAGFGSSQVRPHRSSMGGEVVLCKILLFNRVHGVGCTHVYQLHTSPPFFSPYLTTRYIQLHNSFTSHVTHFPSYSHSQIEKSVKARPGEKAARRKKQREFNLSSTRNAAENKAKLENFAKTRKPLSMRSGSAHVRTLQNRKAMAARAKAAAFRNTVAGDKDHVGVRSND